MDIKNINFYYFTGTGNTLLVVREMKKFFDKQGIQTKLFAIEKEDPKNVTLDAMIGLAFPVAVFTTYPVVMKFIKGLPQANGTKIFMVDTMGGMSLGIRSYLSALLKKKGYDTVAAKQICMPDNFWPSPEKDVKNPPIINKAVNRTQKYAYDILMGKGKWCSCVPIFPSICYAISQFMFAKKSFRTAVKFVQSRCVKCGLCSKLCPVGNITMSGYPTLNGRCELCMRCISFCPKGALYRRKEGEHVYKAVSAEELL